MEALAAFGLAANVLQFFEVTTKFSVKVTKLVTSGAQATQDLTELKTISLSLKDVLQQMQQSRDHLQPENPGIKSSNPNLGLYRLSSSCIKIVDQLLETLDKVLVHKSQDGPNAMVTAFKAMWNEGKIKDLQYRISKHRDELSVELLMSMRSHLAMSLETQEAILAQLKSTASPTPQTDQPKPYGDVVLEYLSRNLPAETRQAQSIKLKESMIALILGYKDHSNILPPNSAQYNLPESQREKAEGDFIQILSYDEMAEREATIVEPHEATFQWIMRSDPDGRKDPMFKEWLSSDDKLYWITGKAGSGKSTLMKYLARSDDEGPGSQFCKQNLQPWMDRTSSRLVVASFYIWGFGSAIAASQDGLFRALLVQLLEACPHIIPRVSPKAWEGKCIFDEDSMDFNYQTLLEKTVRAITKTNTKICFLVDGLDEYKGDPGYLVSVFQDILSSGHVKLCVSSRPWLIFEDAFSHAPNMMLQDFTRPDILQFVTSKLGQNEGYLRLQKRDTAFASQLIDNITDKSAGVFLWVHLVVRSLLAGLTYDDRISDLQRRLDLLPPDLERLYKAILDTLDPFYYAHAAQYFKFVSSSISPPHALLFALADEEDQKFALKLPVHEMAESEYESRVDTTRRRINSRCKGFLEIGHGEKVQYLHRTVKDYLNSPEVQAKLDQAVGDYDCYLQHCSAQLAMLKLRITNQYATDLPQLWECVTACLSAASGITKNKSLMIQMLDCLDETLKKHLPTTSIDYLYSSAADHYKWCPWLQDFASTSFLGLAVRSGVVDFVRARASAGGTAACLNPEHSDTKEFPIGEVAKSTSSSRFKRLSAYKLLFSSGNSSPAVAMEWPLLLDANYCRPPNLQVYKCLLDMGADPNTVFYKDGSTIWSQVVASMVVDCLYDTSSIEKAWWQWLPVMQLFGKRGAKIDRDVLRLILKRLHHTRQRMLDEERLFVALQCVVDGKEDLALEYFRGENNLSAFKWPRKSRKWEWIKTRAGFFL